LASTYYRHEARINDITREEIAVGMIGNELNCPF